MTKQLAKAHAALTFSIPLPQRISWDMIVTQDDFDHCIADVLYQVFRRHCPLTLLIEDGAHALQNHFWLSAAEHVGAAFDRLRPFSDITDGHIGYPEDATLFLHGAAVAKHADGIAFQGDKFKEAKGGQEADLVIVNAKGLHPCLRARVRADDDGYAVLLLQTVGRRRHSHQARFDVHQKARPL